jgi:hypothetical protein
MVLGISRDTTGDAVRVQHQALRRLGLAGRAAMTFQLGDNLRGISESGIRLHHPQFTKQELQAATAKRIVGRELAGKLGTRLGQGAAMSQQDFFSKIVSALGSAGIPIMVVGSLASSFHGDPRATRDADIVIRPDKQSLEKFLQQVTEEFYVSPEAARQALQNHSMFNVIDAASGWKVDLIFAAATGFAEQSFARRITANVMGIVVAIQSPEDTILSKLSWGKDSGSEMQYRDALGVALQQWGKLDSEYLRRWAVELEVSETLEKLLQQAQTLSE